MGWDSRWHCYIYKMSCISYGKFLRRVRAALKALAMGKGISEKQTLAGDARQPRAIISHDRETPTRQQTLKMDAWGPLVHNDSAMHCTHEWRKQQSSIEIRIMQSFKDHTETVCEGKHTNKKIIYKIKNKNQHWCFYNPDKCQLLPKNTTQSHQHLFAWLVMQVTMIKSLNLIWWLPRKYNVHHVYHSNVSKTMM